MLGAGYGGLRTQFLRGSRVREEEVPIKPIGQVSTKAWYLALRRDGIEDFRWHDLRHTWGSWHVQQGTPLFAVQAMGGWESSEMVRRYAHLAAEHLAPHAERLVALRVMEDSNQGTLDRGTFAAHAEKTKGLPSGKPLNDWRAQRDSNS